MESNSPSSHSSLASLDALAGTANEEYHLAAYAARSALEHARRSGDALLRAKELLGHGKFLPWVREHFESSDRTARAFMQIASNWQRVANSEATSLRGALALLQPREPVLPTPMLHIAQRCARIIHPEIAHLLVLTSPAASPGFFNTVVMDFLGGSLTTLRRPISEHGLNLWASSALGVTNLEELEVHDFDEPWPSDPDEIHRLAWFALLAAFEEMTGGAR